MYLPLATRLGLQKRRFLRLFFIYSRREQIIVAEYRVKDVLDGYFKSKWQCG
jgi:hypothetical protein